MYLPVDVLVNEPPVAVAVEENPPPSDNADSQHLQHEHPLANYQQQHPPDIQPADGRDQYQIRTHNQPTHFLSHLRQQQQFSILASSLRLQQVSLQVDEHIFQQQTEFEQENKQVQHFNSQPLDPCADCGQPIKDRFYLVVSERCWHVDCLRCRVCKVKLESQATCFSRDGIIYCKDDYYQRFCKRCARCSRILSPKELVMRAKEFIFHVNCFNCVVCTSALHPGDYFALAPTGLLYCQNHYEPLFYGSGTVPVTHPIGSPTGSEIDIPIAGRDVGYGTSPPGKNTCGDSVEAIATPLKGTSKGQKGRPRKRKSFGGDQQQEMAGSCLASQTDMTSVSQPHLHAAAGRDQLPNLMTAPGSGNSTLTSRLSGCQMPNAPGMVQSGRSSPSSAAGCSSSTVHSQSNQQLQTRSKRMRTSFKHHQLRTMKAYFTLNHNPDAKDLKQLAQKTGLTKRVLQVWFQNARAKYRRSLQIKQMQDTQNPSKSPGPAIVAGTAGSSSDVGESTAFGTDQEDHSTEAEPMGADVASSRHSSDSSNNSSDYSHGSVGRSGFTEEAAYGTGEGESDIGAGGSDQCCIAGDLASHDEARQAHRLRNQRQSLSEEDSASRSLADYFQQCQSGLL